jgi:hypothetical protein
MTLGRPIFPLSLGRGVRGEGEIALTLSLSQRERASLLASLSNASFHPAAIISKLTHYP